MSLRFGATVSRVGQLDLGYAPPYSTAIDLAGHAANIIENKMKGLARAISPLEVKAKLEHNEDFIWLDARSPTVIVPPTNQGRYSLPGRLFAPDLQKILFYCDL